MPEHFTPLIGPDDPPPNVTLRPTFVAICDHEVCAALVLDLLVVASRRAQKHGMSPWIGGRRSDISRALSYTFKESAIDPALKLLESEELVDVKPVAASIHSSGRLFQPAWTTLQERIDALPPLPVLRRKDVEKLRDLGLDIDFSQSDPRE